MTLSLMQLRDHVASKFPEVEVINNSTLRFMKELKGSPYAVCYLNIAQGLPESKEALAKYMDQVIGSHYFKDRKSLQWSNYLYFITQSDPLGSDELHKVKELIERDRNYARKFVIPVEEIDSILTPPVVVPQATTPHANVLSVWAELLTEAGLDKAILTDADLPTRLKLIESSQVALTANAKTRKRTATTTTETFIRSLHLNKFRDCPHQKSFTFGTVNLIFGANGSGKTSLLEAIELYYCGKNKRNPKSRPQYEIVAGFADGRSEIVTANRKPQAFRDRNLVWYGQPETNTQNLYQSFSQFNFLDTDAAVSLTDSVSRIEDDLSKLLVGPDASKTWRDIERVFDAVKGKRRDLSSLETQINEELSALNKLIKDSSEIRQESDSIQARLEEMINRVGWNHGKADKESTVNLVEALSELISIAHQTATLNWTESPVSLNAMDEYCRRAKIVGEEVNKSFIQLGQMQSAHKKLADSIKRDREALELAKDVKRIAESGVFNCSESRNKQQDLIASYSEKLAGIDTDSLRALFPTYLDMKLLTCCEEALIKRSSAKTSLATSRVEYQDFCKLRDQSLNLIQELQQIADRIIHDSSKPDECPLCHTSFEQGELSKRIHVSGDDHLASLGQKLLDQIQVQELALHDATTFDAVLASLLKFCERTKLSQDISIRSVLTEVASTKKKLLNAQDELSSADGKMHTLESQGFSVQRMVEISERLSELGRPLSGFLQEDVDRLIFVISDSLPILSNDLANEGKAIEQLRQVITESLDATGSDALELKNKQSQLEERIVTTESIVAKLRHFTLSNFPWPGDRSIAELIIETESIRKVAADMQLALGREIQAENTYTQSIKRRDNLQKKLKDLQLRLNRYQQAQITFKSLISEHSLKSAMDSALQENRECIESIFKSIHSPVEFRGLGSSWSTLVRKLDGSEAKLSEISTGQRAAFALSIFLAQNVQLKDAPPVVLIDDPIAHVDDLNSLSFLDYLREIVLKGKRQIFFVTADDKLASLFHRKFDFLGPDEFRRINLSREL
jgi:recombinational DNA repair ATPase RecF